jgi:hypothetical protein
MAENAAGRRLLTRCFTLAELDYLQCQPRFQKAVASMDTLTDFESVAALGQNLLADRDRLPQNNERAARWEQMHQNRTPPS